VVRGHPHPPLVVAAASPVVEGGAQSPLMAWGWPSSHPRPLGMAVHHPWPLMVARGHPQRDGWATPCFFVFFFLFFVFEFSFFIFFLKK